VTALLPPNPSLRRPQHNCPMEWTLSTSRRTALLYSPSSPPLRAPIGGRFNVCVLTPRVQIFEAFSEISLSSPDPLYHPETRVCAFALPITGCTLHPFSSFIQVILIDLLALSRIGHNPLVSSFFSVVLLFTVCPNSRIAPSPQKVFTRTSFHS